ncbi:hypothetical protein GGR28_003003 [Lewinella aquimaris]|uniref:Uncharacterized protein n=1 Tax=Neolewinella aquimaris TaxID=1835722 RepID=A0A840EEZ4_9BACT|nr:hypothetical protein [Neolewinella aquimaris]
MKHSAEISADFLRIAFITFLALVLLSLFFIPTLANFF